MLDRFASISGSDRTGGSGLGLAIVKAFAEAMGAALTVGDRKPGPGAAFTIRFPERLILKPMSRADAG